MNKMLSIEELNEVLKKLKNPEYNQKKILISGTFSEVDIVFVAGLLLWYKQNNDMPKIDCSKLTIENQLYDNDRSWIHQHYFKQIKELYNVDYKEIFSDFPNANSGTACTYSRSFAPILYINEKNLKLLFVDDKEDGIFKNIKGEYINALKETNSNKDEINYFKKDNITETLVSLPPIYTFVFSVAYHKINPFVKYKAKGFKDGQEGIKKIWQFTQEYVSGLHELAKNIVEHSTNKQGMITLRAYPGQDEDNEKIKTLETHVFDFGETGIIPKLKEYSKNNIKTEQELTDNQRKINKCYENDF